MPDVTPGPHGLSLHPQWLLGFLWGPFILGGGLRLLLGRAGGGGDGGSTEPWGGCRHHQLPQHDTNSSKRSFPRTWCLVFSPHFLPSHSPSLINTPPLLVIQQLHIRSCARLCASPSSPSLAPRAEPCSPRRGPAPFPGMLFQIHSSNSHPQAPLCPLRGQSKTNLEQHHSP